MYTVYTKFFQSLNSNDKTVEKILQFLLNIDNYVWLLVVKDFAYYFYQAVKDLEHQKSSILDGIRIIRTLKKDLQDQRNAIMQGGGNRLPRKVCKFVFDKDSFSLAFRLIVIE